MLPRRAAPPSALLQSNLAMLDSSPGYDNNPLVASSRASSAQAISIVSMPDPTSVSDRRDTTQAASSYQYLESTQRKLLNARREMGNRRQSNFPSNKIRSGTSTDSQQQQMLTPREHVEFHKTEEEYGLTKEEREWLRGLYERYRQEVPHEDALKELLWNVDRDSMDDQQLHSKLQGTFPSSAYQPLPPTHRSSVSPSATTSPQTTTLNFNDFIMPTSTTKSIDFLQQQQLQPSSTSQVPIPVLSFEQLLDYAVMVKTQCAARNVSDQMTLDAFVLLGGCEDGSGEVQLDTLRQTILDFHLNIDVESFVAAVDKDGDGTIMYHEFAWLYNEGLMELASPSSGIMVQTPSNFFAPAKAADGLSERGGSDNATPSGVVQKTSRNVSPIALTSPSLHAGLKGLESSVHFSSATKVEATLQILNRGSIARALSVMHGDAYSGVSPSKRGAGHHSKGRVRPAPVPCRDLADPDTILQRLEDVGLTHEHRLAYGEQSNRRHLADANAQGNHLLADHVNDLFFKKASTSDASPCETTAPSEVSGTPRRRQRVTLKAKVNFAQQSPAASRKESASRQGSVTPRRVPTVAELVQQQTSARRSTRGAPGNPVKDVATNAATAKATAEVERAMDALQAALHQLDVARRHAAVVPPPTITAPHQSSKPKCPSVTSGVVANVTVSTANHHQALEPLPAIAPPASPPSTAAPPVMSGGMDQAEEGAAAGGYDDDFDTDVEAHNVTAVGLSNTSRSSPSSSSQSSSRQSRSRSRSSGSSRSFSVASSSEPDTPRSSSGSNRDTKNPALPVAEAGQGIDPPAAGSVVVPRSPLTATVPHAPAAPNERPIRSARVQAHAPTQRSSNVASAIAPKRPMSAKHHLLTRRPQTASSQSRLCRTTGRAYDDDKLSRVASTITATQPHRVVDALKRCAAEGNSVTLVAEEPQKKTSRKLQTTAAPPEVEAAQTEDALLMDRWTRH